jgi:hypothetical protein
MKLESGLVEFVRSKRTSRIQIYFITLIFAHNLIFPSLFKLQQDMDQRNVDAMNYGY